MDASGAAARERAESLPARWYTDAGIFALECERIFGSEWLVVGHAELLSRSGDRFEQTIAGRALTLRRYAASGLNGSFRRLGPDVAAVRPLHPQAWRGLVFANCAPRPSPLSVALAELDRRAEAYAIEDYRYRGEAYHVLACNWKTYVENYLEGYLEGYHVRMAHPGLAKQIDTRNYRVHVGHRAAVHVAPTRDGTAYEGLWIWLYPNLALNLHGGGMSVERMLPLAPDRTCVHYWFFFAPDAPEAEMEEARGVRAEVTAEDKRVCEAVQRDLAAGVYDKGRLSPKHESGAAYFQRLVRRAVEGSPSGRGLRRAAEDDGQGRAEHERPGLEARVLGNEGRQHRREPQ